MIYIVVMIFFLDQKIHTLSQKYPFGSQKASQGVFTRTEISQRADKGMDRSFPINFFFPGTFYQYPLTSIGRHSPQERINGKEKHQLKAIIGSLQYAAENTRPDLASQLSQLRSAVNSALLSANKTLHKAKKHHNVSMQIQLIPPKELRFLAFSDASFASRKVPDSHAG